MAGKGVGRGASLPAHMHTTPRMVGSQKSTALLGCLSPTLGLSFPMDRSMGLGWVFPPPQGSWCQSPFPVSSPDILFSSPYSLSC